MTQRSESWTSLFMIKCQSTSECITKAWSEVRGFATTGPRVYVLLESGDVIFVSPEQTVMTLLVVGGAEVRGRMAKFHK